MLIGILLLAVGIVFAITGADQATAYGLHNLTTSSPIFPTPTPLPPKITGVDPGRGVSGVVVQINIYGANFKEGSQVYLQSSEQGQRSEASERPLIPLASRYVSSAHIVAKIPAQVENKPLDVGYYNVIIQYADQQAVRTQAYRTLDPVNLDDLYAQPYHLNSIPSALRVGEEARLALNVHRMGGIGGTDQIFVDFYVNSVNDANLIGSAKTLGISPNDNAHSSFVTWTPTERGDVKLIAVIDAGDVFTESDETNNIVEATRHVSMRMAADTYPPVVSGLTVDNGAREVRKRDVALSALVEDLPDPANPTALVSGPNRIYYVELHWFSGINSWIPVNWTDWLLYHGSADDFTLHPTPGLRYLQAWGADASGNISNLPDGRSLTYLPNEDEVAQGEVRVYRREVAAGQCLSVQIVPDAAQMDPDLYVWPPAGNPVYSLNGAGASDQVTIQPTVAGSYQIEVEGFTDAVYTITIDVTESCSQGRTDQPNLVAAKTPRSVPSIPVDEAPKLSEAPAPQEEIIQYLMFLSVAKSSARTESTQNLYLPVLTR
jgi:hypothetical protein